MKKIGILRFPGTNCDRDIETWVTALGLTFEYLWHRDLFAEQDFTALVLPGGFSYGDYLRSGALAARSRVMNSVNNFAKTGKPILGICNGFQILTEMHLLPGALVQNQGGRFIDDWVRLQVVNANQHFGRSVLATTLPIAHGDGRYYASPDQLKQLEDNGLIWLKYIDNPNGSVADIAGVMNKQKNICGLMPHPERAIFSWMGCEDGMKFLEI